MHERARERATALEPRLSYLIINVPDASRIEGLVVARNGSAVDPASWNRALPVDGGTYVVSGKAPGHEAWSTTVVVTGESDRKSVDVPRFHPLPEPAAISGGGQPRSEEESVSGRAIVDPENLAMIGAACARLIGAVLSTRARAIATTVPRRGGAMSSAEMHDAAISGPRRAGSGCRCRRGS